MSIATRLDENRIGSVSLSLRHALVPSSDGWMDSTSCSVFYE